jgi:penicillin-binding protein 1C
VDLPPRYASWAAAAGLPHPASVVHADLRSGGGRPSPAVLRSAESVRLSILSPEQNLRVLRDPETPPAQATLALRVVVDPPVPQVVWYVDGHAFEIAEYPYTARWSLVPGDHVFEVRVPPFDTRSGRVHVHVE